jgi:hypothetical protein
MRHLRVEAYRRGVDEPVIARFARVDSQAVPSEHGIHGTTYITADANMAGEVIPSANRDDTHSGARPDQTVRYFADRSIATGCHNRIETVLRRISGQRGTVPRALGLQNGLRVNIQLLGMPVNCLR